MDSVRFGKIAECLLNKSLPMGFDSDFEERIPFFEFCGSPHRHLHRSTTACDEDDWDLPRISDVALLAGR